ncbi:nematode cuticle collagen domain protein [Cooperia oncophora]
MFEEKLIIGVASAFSILTIAACLIVIPSLYNTINEMHDQVLETVSVFRVETDSAWTQMMDYQVAVAPPSKPVRIHSAPSSVRRDRLVFRLTASARLQRSDAHLDHLDLLDVLEHLDSPEDLVNLVETAPPISFPSTALAAAPLVFNAQLDREDHPDQVELLETEDLMATQDVLEVPEMLVDQVPLDLPETEEHQETLDPLDSLDLLEDLVPVEEELLDVQDLLDQLELQETLEDAETMVHQEDQEDLVQLVSQEDEETLEEMVNLEELEILHVQEAMLLIAHAHLATLKLVSKLPFNKYFNLCSYFGNCVNIK